MQRVLEGLLELLIVSLTPCALFFTRITVSEKSTHFWSRNTWSSWAHEPADTSISIKKVDSLD